MNLKFGAFKVIYCLSCFRGQSNRPYIEIEEVRGKYFLHCTRIQFFNQIKKMWAKIKANGVLEWIYEERKRNKTYETIFFVVERDIEELLGHNSTLTPEEKVFAFRCLWKISEYVKRKEENFILLDLKINNIGNEN